MPRPTTARSISRPQEGESAGTEADQTVQGPQPAVMADGTVVVAYLDTTLDGVQEGLATIMVTLSEDGGRTFASRSRPVSFARSTSDLAIRSSVGGAPRSRR